jgi:hypothetical protein
MKRTNIDELGQDSPRPILSPAAYRRALALPPGPKLDRAVHLLVLNGDDKASVVPPHSTDAGIAHALIENAMAERGWYLELKRTDFEEPGRIGCEAWHAAFQPMRPPVDLPLVAGVTAAHAMSRAAIRAMSLRETKSDRFQGGNRVRWRGLPRMAKSEPTITTGFTPLMFIGQLYFVVTYRDGCGDRQYELAKASDLRPAVD